MTETVWIVLIGAAVVVLLAFRGRLTNAAIEVVRGKKVKASLTAQPHADTSDPGLVDTSMVGANEIDVTEDTRLTRVGMWGKNKIKTRSSTNPTATKPPAR